MADKVELVLVLGDYHIPHRASAVPEQFQRILLPNNKITQVLCTGNLVTKEQADDIKNLAPAVHIVRGSFDEDPSLPESKVVQIGQFKIGLMNGYQIVPWGDPHSLAMVQRQLDVDILITGHTHRNESTEYKGKWFINPGSITGAYSTLTPDVTPSFILLSIQGNKVVIYGYELKNDQVEVTRSEFSKK